jgi:hypothetical protein
MKKDTADSGRGQGSGYQSEVLSDLCYRFVQPLLHRMNAKLDRRLVQTMLDMLN